jgi:hypothetical protein
MATETYTRGQIEWAAWGTLRGDSVSVGLPPKKFCTRIKRLLDSDRGLKSSNLQMQPKADFAFAPPPAVGGSDVAYTAFDVFCLAIGLDLLDCGFKQKEITVFMRYSRPYLERQFQVLLDRPSLIDRQRYLAGDFPDLPFYEEDGQRFVDSRVFAILQKVELTEILPATPRRQKKGPMLFEPIFCEGATALGEELRKIMPYHRRALTVLELTATAQAVQKNLADAPIIRRGRPKG